MNELNIRIGEEMRQQRRLRHLTQEYVAERMGFRSKNTISRMEKGDTMITVEDLKRYCDIIGCSYLDILRRATADE